MEKKVVAFKTRTQQNQIAHHKELLKVLEDKLETALHLKEVAEKAAVDAEAMSARIAIALKSGNVGMIARASALETEAQELYRRALDLEIDYIDVVQNYPRLIAAKKAFIEKLEQA